jgi:alkylation response protein AidB-like acyl-CoA dehydrogenase
MSDWTQSELDEFAAGADAWFRENTPKDPGFMLPLTFMEVGSDQQFDFLREWQRKIYEAGYLGAAWPDEYGGGGLPEEFQSAATGAMRKYDGPILLNAIGLNWTGPLIIDIGTQMHKQKYLKGILSAEDIWCQGFSEPEHGSDLGNAQLRAVRDGDEYILNGSKTWTTLGKYAKYMILLARTDLDAPSKYAGLSFILTPMNVAGVATHNIRKLTGEYGFTQTFFTDARIPIDGLVGREGQGWKVAMQTLEYERRARGGQAGGYIMKEIDAFGILKLARKAERNGQPVLDDPVIRDQLVDFVMEAQSLNLNGLRGRIPALNQDYPKGLALMTKLQFSEFAREVGQFALSLQGSKSAYYVDDPNAVDNGIWTRAYLNAFSATIGGGTSQIQHNIIGEHVLGLPKTK